MNQSVPTWNMESSEAQKRSLGADNDLVELLWRNGQVVQHSQTHRKPAHIEIGYKKKPEREGESFMNFSTLIEEDETASWIQYPLDDSLAGDLCSNFFYELTNSQPVEKDKAIKHFGSFLDTGASNGALPLQQQTFRLPNSLNFVEDGPIVHISNSSLHPNSGGVLDRVENFPHFSRTIKAEVGAKYAPVKGSGVGFVNGGDIGESSVMTIGSSHCGSNQFNKDDRSRVSSNGLGSRGMFKGPVKENNRKTFPESERGLTETLETTITSSSGASGGSYGGTEKQSTHIQRSKRKGRDTDESECQSEDTNSESAGANKASQRSGSTRRSRAAEVHNLSERRRRDRINEKMRALQDLIPHCNKSDKASMLDEAIEYLKSLRLQVQMMWMGSGMAPMMFPGVQHYISRMGMGMHPHPSLPSINNPMQLPKMSLVNQSMSRPPLSNQPAVCPSVLNGVNFQNGMQTPDFFQPFARQMGFQHMQTPDFFQPFARQMGFQHMQTPQSVSMYGFGSQIAQQNPKIGLHSSGAPLFQGGATTDNTRSGKLV